jgi:TRAP-type C4-dicarboxylate transport system permease small subunit
MLEFSGEAPGYIVALIALGIAADVLMRNVGLGGISWMLESVEYALYVLTFTGAAHALNKGRHVSIDFFGNTLSKPIAHGLTVFATSVVFVICLILLIYSTMAVVSAYVDNSMVFKSFTIAEWVPLSYLLPTILLLTAEAARRFIKAVKTGEIDTIGSGLGV